MPTPPEFHSDTPIVRLFGLLTQLEADLQLDAQSPAKTTLDEAIALVKGFDSYLLAASTSAPAEVLGNIQASDTHDWEGAHRRGETRFRLIKEMSSGPFEAVVLQQLARMSKAATVLEVGQFCGSTALALALLPQVTRVVTLDLEPYLLKIAEPWWEKAGVRDKIVPVIGDANASLEELARNKQQFEFIFIDANKDGYRSYYDHVMDHGLLAPDGTILVDNTLYKATPWLVDPEYEGLAQHIRSFNEYVRNDPRVTVVILPIRDGVSLIRLRDAAS